MDTEYKLSYLEELLSYSEFLTARSRTFPGIYMIILSELKNHTIFMGYMKLLRNDKVELLIVDITTYKSYGVYDAQSFVRHVEAKGHNTVFNAAPHTFTLQIGDELSDNAVNFAIYMTKTYWSSKYPKYADQTIVIPRNDVNQQMWNIREQVFAARKAYNREIFSYIAKQRGDIDSDNFVWITADNITIPALDVKIRILYEFERDKYDGTTGIVEVIDKENVHYRTETLFLLDSEIGIPVEKLVERDVKIYEVSKDYNKSFYAGLKEIKFKITTTFASIYITNNTKKKNLIALAEALLEQANAL